ncbi:MAG TPA: hypothetical protein VHQ01_02525, partial [Pyrinomonadaceae bacterium]|nr:hypothetical protein [Pyrinomonadaceae bacterium]
MKRHVLGLAILLLFCSGIFGQSVRTLSLGNVDIIGRGETIVPVTLTATGAEYGLSFAANWNPELLTFTGYDAGATTLPASCVMAVNPYSVDQGR